MIFDEHGTPWSVQAGDPARKLVSRLTRMHYDTIVLPRSVLMTGEGTAQSHAAPEDTAPKDLPMALRLADCVHALRSNT